MSEENAAGKARECDVAVIGAGLGGIYAIHRFRRDGLDVVGLESASDVGGVWFHNRYPGARVDIESLDYCFHFSAEIYRDWTWTERFAAQPELLAYLNYVADRTGVRPFIRFDTRMTSARWDEDVARWQVTTSAGEPLSARFLVMATGSLSAAREPAIAGLDTFGGQWVQTSHWPEDGIDYEGKRVGVIGTGSSGVQTIPVIAQKAAHLTVFQRTANFTAPARNGPIDPDVYAERRHDFAVARDRVFGHHAGTPSLVAPTRAFADMAPEDIEPHLQSQWQRGGLGMALAFTDQYSNLAAGDAVSDFVRARIRETVKNPDTAEKLCPRGQRLGDRRPIIDTQYYQTYNRENVALVDVSADPIERITPTGIQTASGHHDLDLIVFALGFEAFTGAIFRADIRNAAGQTPADRWQRGPRTMLGTMTAGFPNLFFVAGPGSPSILVALMTMNELSIDWIADCIAWTDAQGARAIEATPEGEEDWLEEVAAVARPRLARQIDIGNYMVHRNDDDMVFIPWPGGLPLYLEKADAIVKAGYRGFRLHH